MTDLTTRSATQLASLIRDGEVSSREVVDAHIAKVKRVNPMINAVVVDRFDAARAEADAADAYQQRSRSLPMFHGVPCTIKESFAVQGMPNSAGLVARKDHRALEDAITVKRLRAAGGVVMGVTNTSELCMWMETHNRIYGRTKNPYDQTKHVGGSSGGEGAIIGSGASPFGLGADVGGSIRMPAFFNGVFGHKPSAGLVPNSGQFPIAHGRALRYLSSGPLCRRAEDLWPLLTTLAGPDGEDLECERMKLGSPKIKLSKVRIVHVPGVTSPLMSDVDTALLDAQQQAVDWLASRGAEVVERQFEPLKDAFDIWSSMLGEAEGPSVFRNSMGKGKRRILGQLARRPAGRAEHTTIAMLTGLLENTTFWSKKRLERMLQAGAALRAAMLEAMGDDGVLFFPTHPKMATRHRSPMLTPFNSGYTGIINVMELPATQVPMGLHGGLPTGFQIVGTPGGDHRTVGLALQLEERFGGWVPPTGI